MTGNLMAQVIMPLERILMPLAQRGQPPPWGPGMMGNWSFYGMTGWFGSFVMLVFWGLIILVLLLLARWLWSQSHGKREPGRSEPALDILKRRYAMGEIDREEFELKKKDLAAP
jgi:putative membrane protein